MRPLELDVAWRELERLVDHQVGADRADPGDGYVRVEAEDVVEEAEHVGFNQRERDAHVEEDPHDPATPPRRSSGTRTIISAYWPETGGYLA